MSTGLGDLALQLLKPRSTMGADAVALCGDQNGGDPPAHCPSPPQAHQPFLGMLTRLRFLTLAVLCLACSFIHQIFTEHLPCTQHHARN